MILPNTGNSDGFGLSSAMGTLSQLFQPGSTDSNATGISFADWNRMVNQARGSQIPGTGTPSTTGTGLASTGAGGLGGAGNALGTNILGANGAFPAIQPGIGGGTNLMQGMMFRPGLGGTPQGLGFTGAGGATNMFNGMTPGLGTNGAAGALNALNPGMFPGMTQGTGTNGASGATNLIPATGTTGLNGMGSTAFAAMNPNSLTGWAGATTRSNLVTDNLNPGSAPVFPNSGGTLGSANMFPGFGLGSGAGFNGGTTQG